MKSITIKGQERESVGKKATKALRDAGMVPCVIYGGEQPVHFAAEDKAFTKVLGKADAEFDAAKRRWLPKKGTVVLEKN